MRKLNEKKIPKILRKNNEKICEKMQKFREKIRKFHDKNGNYAKNENFVKNKCKILAKMHQKY